MSVGLVVHDDNVTTRFHLVSFPLTFGSASMPTSKR
jgi:hypothetical protein